MSIKPQCFTPLLLHHDTTAFNQVNSGQLIKHGNRIEKGACLIELPPYINVIKHDGFILHDYHIIINVSVFFALTGIEHKQVTSDQHNCASAKILQSANIIVLESLSSMLL